jgi:hypothetical protein
VVHDWLYYFIYLDLYRFFPGMRKRRGVVQFITFIISAVIHEFIIYYALGFFYPILFILFAGPGTLPSTQASSSSRWPQSDAVRSTSSSGSNSTSGLPSCSRSTSSRPSRGRRSLIHRWRKCGAPCPISYREPSTSGNCDTYLIDLQSYSKALKVWEVRGGNTGLIKCI